jgi:two-component system phosphate regulon sensor histidine kinase PhoR
VILLTAALCELLTASIMGWILVTSLEQEKQRELSNEAILLMQAIEAQPQPESGSTVETAAVASLHLSDIRVTWIDAQGSILYDSVQDEQRAMENHAGRPEFDEALRNGTGSAARFSSTLGEISYYHAVRLGDGTVLRLSATQNAVIIMLGRIALPALATLAVLSLAGILAARVLARRITAPLVTLDLDDPLANRVYEEIRPLLARMDEQRHGLAERVDQGARVRRAFTANISHELKTPLTVISGYAELMKNRQVSDRDVPHFSSLIHDEAQHMRDLVNDVLTLAQLDELAPPSAGGPLIEQPEIVNLNELAAETINRLAQFADQHNVSFHLAGSKEASVVGWAHGLESLVYNLCENAIRYNKPGGSVTVTVERTVEQAQGGRVVLRVADTGIGIALDDRERVFERFFRVDKTRSRATGGTGLGLAIVKHVAMLHGAELSLTSELGTGTEVTVIFSSC